MSTLLMFFINILQLLLQKKSNRHSSLVRDTLQQSVHDSFKRLQFEPSENIIHSSFVFSIFTLWLKKFFHD